MMKKILPLLLAAALLLSLAACGKKAAYLYIITIRMGAEVELSAGDDGTVAQITARNKEAASLCPDTNFSGMKMADALSVLIKAALDAGLLTDGQTIALSLLDTGKGSPDIESILKEIGDAISKVLTDANVSVNLDVSSSQETGGDSLKPPTQMEIPLYPQDDPAKNDPDPVQPGNDQPVSNPEPVKNVPPVGRYFSYDCNGVSGTVYYVDYNEDGTFNLVSQFCATAEEMVNKMPWVYSSVEDVLNDPTNEWITLDGVDYTLGVGSANVVSADYEYDPASETLTLLGGFNGWDDFVGRSFTRK